MKKISFILMLFAFIFVGCDLFTKPSEPEKKDPVAEIHIPVGNNSARRIYTYDDVSSFTVTLIGEDVDGESVNELCGNYNYDTTNDEIVVYIEKAGYYSIEVAASKLLKEDVNKIIATGKSSAFRIVDGDNKTIIIDMVYSESKVVETSTLYRFYNNTNPVKVYSITFNHDITPKDVENYVTYLKENASEKWYDSWGMLEYEIDLDKVILSSNAEIINSPYTVSYYNDDQVNFYHVPIEDKYYGIVHNVRVYKNVFFDENATNFKLNKTIDTDYDSYFYSFKTLDYIYTTDENGDEIEKIAYYNGENPKNFDQDEYKEWKDFTELGLGRDWVMLENTFDNIISIDFTDTSTDGGIQINW